MRLIYVIFRKDTIRFWWEIVVTIGVLALLSWHDIDRYDFVPGPTEGLLNLLLPAVWAYLIAAVIHEEALVGDRQFWITRPYPRPTLLAAKLLFIAVFVHVPVLLADSFILWNHGFSPGAYLPQLLFKQLTIAGWVTLPSIALAAVTRNVAQFFPAAVAIVTVGYFGLAMGGGIPRGLWIAFDARRATISLGAAGVIVAAVVYLQYLQRRTNLSRVVLGVAVLTAGGLYAYIPRVMTSSGECRPQPQNRQGLSIRVDDSIAPPRWGPSYPSLVEMRVPVRVDGLALDEQMMLEQLNLELSNTKGRRFEFDRWPSRSRVGADSFLGQVWLNQRDTGVQQVFLGRNVYSQFHSSMATLQGTIAVSKYRERETARTPPAFEIQTVPSVGHCSSSLVPNTMGRGDLLRAFCESPNPIPRPTIVTLRSPQRNAPWRHILGDSAPFTLFALDLWLSPLHRRQTFFQIVERSDAPESSAVPREALKDATLQFAIHQPLGCEIVSYRFENVSLRRP